MGINGTVEGGENPARGGIRQGQYSTGGRQATREDGGASLEENSPNAFACSGFGSVIPTLRPFNSIKNYSPPPPSRQPEHCHAPFTTSHVVPYISVGFVFVVVLIAVSETSILETPWHHP